MHQQTHIPDPFTYLVLAHVCAYAYLWHMLTHLLLHNFEICLSTTTVKMKNTSLAPRICPDVFFTISLLKFVKQGLMHHRLAEANPDLQITSWV